jgi:hypothetical protein
VEIECGVDHGLDGSGGGVGTISGASTLNTVGNSAAIRTGVGGGSSRLRRSSLRRENTGILTVVVEKEEMTEGEKAGAEKEEEKQGKRGKDEDIETMMEEDKVEAGLGVAVTMADGTQARVKTRTSQRWEDR